MRRICAVVLAAILAAFGAEAQIFCWNLENFFDHKDDPATADEAFTPGGEHRWTRRKWEAKRNLIAKTIIASSECFGGEMPALVGLCEVENRYVLESLANDTPLARLRYRILHRDSPDPRGIDVALLYDPARVRLLASEFITIKEFATRDILYAKVVMGYHDNHRPQGTTSGEGDNHRLRGTPSEEVQGMGDATCEAKSPHRLPEPALQAGLRPAAAACENRVAANSPAAQPADTLYLYVNHWPSKYSGARASDLKRGAVCRALEASLDSLRRVEPNAKIIIMGDLNDTPAAPVIQGLCARANLRNLTADIGGTIKYKGRWETIDQLLASLSAAAIIGAVDAYRADFLLEEDKTFMGRKPRRTNIGPRYNAGASDHLPVIAGFIR